MRRLYNFIIDHISVIATVLMVLIIPDLIFKGWVLFAHMILAAALIVIMLIGEVLNLEYPEEPCRFCKRIYDLPDQNRFSGFVIHDGAIWFNDSGDGWTGTAIYYCPMCGRDLEDDYV